MKNQQSGFTLIELVVVIVILGILAATAVPRFANLTDEANTAVASGIVGAIASSAAIQLATTPVGPKTFQDIGTNVDFSNVAQAAITLGGGGTGSSDVTGSAYVHNDAECSTDGVTSTTIQVQIGTSPAANGILSAGLCSG